MTARYKFETLGTSVIFELENFDRLPRFGTVVPCSMDESADLHIRLVEDADGSELERLKREGLEQYIGNTDSGRYALIHDAEKGGSVCYFDKGLSLEFLFDHCVNRTFLAFQEKIDVIFLHSASIVKADGVEIFSAPSGGGKSTISSLAVSAGYAVIDEEVCLIKRKGEKFFAGSYPGYVNAASLDGRRINALYMLEKSDDNSLRPIGKVEALRRLFPEATGFYTDHVPDALKIRHRGHIFDMLEDMIDKLGCAEYSFSKDRNPFLCSAV